MSKAFDTIPHNILLSKLDRYGIRGNVNDLIRSFLSNRNQFVSIGNVSSTLKSIKFGTPQGSTLGPILFLIYMNDIFNLPLNGRIILFADDAAITYCGTSLVSFNRMMNEDLIMLSNWFAANKLTLNRKKSKCMIFHPQQGIKKYSLTIALDGTPIEQVPTFEYLGSALQESVVVLSMGCAH